MKEVLRALQKQSVISHEEVTKLQLKLKEELPEATPTARAQRFAKAIQERLDRSFSPFEYEVRKALKFYLLKKTIYRENFSINACDVIESYLNVEQAHEEATLTELTNWLNQYEYLNLSLQEVTDLTASFYTLMDEITMTAPSSSLPSIEALQEEMATRHFSLLSIFSTCRKSVLGMLILSFTAFCISIGLFIYAHLPEKKYIAAFEQIEDPTIDCPISLDLEMFANYLQVDLQYKEVDKRALRNYLTTRHSILAQEPYFSSIIEAAKEFNVNPLLLFAITGQEQGFVPVDHENARKIANNPFNVYGSWQTYNTTIKQSARIAAETLIHLGKGCPENEDQIKWINNEYAADPEWHVGVSYFFDAMKEVALPTDQ